MQGLNSVLLHCRQILHHEGWVLTVLRGLGSGRCERSSLKKPRGIHCFVKNKGDMLDFLGGPVVKSLPAKQEIWVQSLVRETSTCHRATQPVCHSS